MDKDRRPNPRRPPPGRRYQIEILSTDGAWLRLWQRYPDRHSARAERDRFIERGHAPKRVRVVESD
jgi:hypothetical protein